MTPSTLMVIDPSITHPEVASFNKIVETCPLPCTFHLPVLSDINSISRSLSNACGIIILGSAASVHDKTDWQSSLGEVIDGAMGKDIPILGICFGHQFLASHLGGQVDYLWDKEKKKGTRQVDIKRNSLIDSERTCHLIYSHQEGIINCPSNFEVIASSDMVKMEGIGHKSKAIWGFQTHIEASWSFAQRQDISIEDYEKANEHGTQIMQSFFKKL